MDPCWFCIVHSVCELLHTAACIVHPICELLHTVSCIVHAIRELLHTAACIVYPIRELLRGLYCTSHSHSIHDSTFLQGGACDMSWSSFCLTLQKELCDLRMSPSHHDFYKSCNWFLLLTLFFFSLHFISTCFGVLKQLEH